MENLNYCLNLIECGRKNSKVIQNEIDSINQSLRNLCSKPDIKDVAEIERLHDARDVLYQDKERQAVKGAILENNTQIAFYEYVLPFVVQVIGKFAGKRIGEKTNEKMKSTFKDLSGCSMYLEDNHVHVHLLDKNGHSDYRVNNIEISFGGNLFDGDNKLLPVESSKATLCYITNRYVDDIDTEVTVLYELYKKVLEASKLLDSACSEYNSHAVGRIPRKYGTHFYKSFMV